MAADWRSFCKGARDLRLEGDAVEVHFAGGRHHLLSVEDVGEAYRVVGIVARPGIVSKVPQLALQVWRRNRATKLAGFRLDPRGRLLGEARVPKPGLSADEFLQWVRIVAAECDRFEHALTGKDVE